MFDIHKQLDQIALNKHLDQSVAYINSKEYNNAINECNEAIKISPNTEKAYLNRGLAYFYTYQYEEALADYNEAIKIKSDYSQAYYNRGLLYLERKELQKALTDFNKSINLDSSSALSFYNRGVTLVELKRHDDSLIDFGRAIELDHNMAKQIEPSILPYVYKNYAIHCYNHGNDLLYKGKFEQAVVFYTKAINIDRYGDLHAAAYSNRGYAYLQLNNYQKTIENCQKAIDIDPYIAAAYLNIGSALASIGKSQEALVYFDKSAALGDPQGKLNANHLRKMLRQ